MVDPKKAPWLGYIIYYDEDENGHAAGDFKDFVPNTPEWIKDEYKKYRNKKIMAK